MEKTYNINKSTSDSTLNTCNSGEYPIEISFSKSKTLLLLLGALAFVALSFWIYSDITAKQIYDLKRLIMIAIALIGVIFFGTCTIFAFLKLFDIKPALILDQNGFIDNSSMTTLGQKILWKDVKSIESYSLHNQNIIKVLLKDPVKYIENTKWFHKRLILKLNLSLSGTPVNISANSLQITFKELQKLLNEQKNKHK